MQNTRTTSPKHPPANMSHQISENVTKFFAIRNAQSKRFSTFAANYGTFLLPPADQEDLMLMMGGYLAKHNARREIIPHPRPQSR